MKTLFATLTATALLATSAFAGEVVKDASGAYSCQDSGGDVISYYNPYGRAPTAAEKTQCTKAGGKIVNPKPSTKKVMPRKQEPRKLNP